MSCPKQKPLQPPRTAPTALEPLSISSKSLQNIRTAAGEEQEKKLLGGLTLGRSGLSPIPARAPHTNFFPLSPIRCSTRQEDTLFRTDRSSTPGDASLQNWRHQKFFVPLGQHSASKFRKVKRGTQYYRPSDTLRGGSRTCGGCMSETQHFPTLPSHP